MAMGSSDPDDRTQSWDLDRQPTLSWSLERKVPASLLYGGAGAAGALLACMVGFWIGRSSAPAPSKPAAETVAAQPVQLPVPPAADPHLVTLPSTPALSPLPSSNRPAASYSAASPPDTPVVTVRPRHQPPRGNTAPARPVYPRTAPPSVVYSQVAPQRQSVTVMRTPATAPLDPLGAGAEPAVVGLTQPDGTRAVVMIRNDDDAPVDVVIDGQGTRTAMIAPGTSLPLTLSAGSYQLRANGRGASSTRSTLALAANRTYRLVVSRREQGGREVLVLIEPAIDGQAGESSG